VSEQEYISKYGVIEAQDGIVTTIVEKPREALSHLVNTGIYAFSNDIFDFIGQETDLPSVIRSMIAQGIKIKACASAGAWLDVVYPWDILKLNDMALTKTQAATGGIYREGCEYKGLGINRQRHDCEVELLYRRASHYRGEL
jgi:NDP-sugar pyrophosphorylase family protein